MEQLQGNKLGASAPEMRVVTSDGHVLIRKMTGAQRQWFIKGCLARWGFPSGASGPASAGEVRDKGCEDPLEEGMATHSTILAWRIPWTEEPGRLQSGSQSPTQLKRISTHTHSQMDIRLQARSRSVRIPSVLWVLLPPGVGLPPQGPPESQAVHLACLHR